MTDPKPTPRRRRRRRRRLGPKTTANRSEQSKPDQDKDAPRPVAPTKAETALLPPFQGISPDQIRVPANRRECQAAADTLTAAGVAGFDTEAKPTFRVGQDNGGPHVVQFALPDQAFIFQLHRPECEDTTAELLASHKLLKVGFGLKNDHSQIRKRFGITLTHVLDLDRIFRKMGYRGQIGVRAAIGALLNQKFAKSKSVTTSNWAAPKLTPKQLLYAANDAFAALKVMEALEQKGHLDL